jgi:hypothetical protein
VQNSPKNWWLFGLVILLAVACAPKPKEGKMLAGEYYALNQVIDAEIKSLTTANAGLYKQVALDDKKEEMLLLPSQLKWSNELALFKDINLNKPAWQGYIKTETTPIANGELVVYTAQKADIPFRRVLMVFNAAKQLDSLAVDLETENEITHTVRTLTAAWENTEANHHLKKYSINGFQKVLLNDTLFYKVNGEVRFNVN